MPDVASRIKVYLEASFFGYLVSETSKLSHVAARQVATEAWWRDEADACDLFISNYVTDEIMDGDPNEAALRAEAAKGIPSLDGTLDAVMVLARRLLEADALPQKAKTDAHHIATAAVHGMDVLLTWNCHHMANTVTLPKTVSVVATAGYRCPMIITPLSFSQAKEKIYGLV